MPYNNTIDYNNLSTEMQIYANRGGDSGITHFKLGDDYIIVRFKDNAVYAYTTVSAGVYNVDVMRRLAVLGSGLNSFISRNKPPYASKRK